MADLEELTAEELKRSWLVSGKRPAFSLRSDTTMFDLPEWAEVVRRLKRLERKCIHSITEAECLQCQQRRAAPIAAALEKFGADAVKGERERCAKIAESHAAWLRKDIKSMFGQIAEACAAHCEKIAARIREGRDG